MSSRIIPELLKSHSAQLSIKLTEFVDADMLEVFSSRRFIEYNIYKQNSSIAKTLFWIVLSVICPVFCVSILLLVPLQDPKLGVWLNYNYFIMAFVSTTSIMYAYSILFEEFLLESRGFGWGNIIASSGFGFAFTLSVFVIGLTVGFPVPFTHIVGCIFGVPVYILVYYIITRKLQVRIKDYSRKMFVVLSTLALHVSAILMFKVCLIIFSRSECSWIKSLFTLIIPLSKLFAKYWQHAMYKRCSGMTTIMNVFVIEYFCAYYACSFLLKSANLNIVLCLIAIDMIQNLFFIYHLISDTFAEQCKKCDSQYKMDPTYNRRNQLHSCEIVLMVELVEATVPVSNALFIVFAREYLSNIQYFAGINREAVNDIELAHSIHGVVLYGCIEIGTMILMSCLMNYRFKINALSIIGFALSSRFKLILLFQASWMFISITISGIHNGLDLTLKFSWMGNNT